MGKKFWITDILKEATDVSKVLMQCDSVVLFCGSATNGQGEGTNPHLIDGFITRDPAGNISWQ